DDQCLGFLVAGARHMQSVELTLRSVDGAELGRSSKPTALAYLQHCGQTGDKVFASFRVLDGQGEVVYAVFPSDEERPAAVRALESCVALGTPRPAPLDIGPEPIGQSIDRQLEVVRTDLKSLGYEPG